MKRLILIFCATLLFSLLMAGADTEKFNYVVTYKWGLIHQDAGTATITKRPHGNGYELKLTAKTKPWADKIYKVRDTLVSITEKERYRPLHYSNHSHEKNKYKRDEIKFSYSGNVVKGATEKYREGKDGKITKSTQQLEGQGNVYDMLSVYFFLRDIDYSKMKSGETIHAQIFSGSKSENLTLKCHGKEKVKLRDKTEQEAWHISFKFTQHGGKKSSDDINCWISTDSEHIPLMIVGTLPVGQIRVYYVPPGGK